MTGHYPARYSVHQHFATPEQNHQRGMPDWLDPKAPMLPRILKSAGYRTGHFGKWHLTNVEAATQAPPTSAYGFDESSVWNGPCPCVMNELKQPDSNPDKYAKYSTIGAVDAAVKFIRANASRPFFMNLWIHETHVPNGATEEDRKPYPDVPEPQQTYDSAVTRADTQIGRVLALLKELKLDNDTLVVFSSDNGPEVGSPDPKAGTYFSVGSTGGLKGRKRSLMMGGISTPFIVRWPGKVPAGRVDKTTPVCGVDLLPTFCAVAGASLPAGYRPDGENVLQAWLGKPAERKQPMFWEWKGNHGGANWPVFGMREGKMGLVTNGDMSRTELYDLVADKGQTTDLSSKQPDLVKRMHQAIREWKATLPKEPPADCMVKA